MRVDQVSTATELVELGHSGVTVTRLGLGSAPLGGLYSPVEDSTAQAVVQRAWELGLRHFDTAPLYGYGRAERRIGAALADRDRDEYTLATKVGRLLVEDGQDRQPQWAETDGPSPRFDFSYAAAMRSVEESLARLGMSRVDVAHIHDPDDHYADAVVGSYRALRDLRSGRQIGAVGVGMNQAEMLTEFVGDFELDCVLLAGRYTLLDQSGLDTLLPLCSARGVSVIAGGVYNSGLLANPRVGSPYDYQPAPEEVLIRAWRIHELCQRYEMPLKAAAIQFPLGHPAVSCVVVGARTVAEIEENVAMFEYRIPGAFWRDLVRSGLLPEHVPTPERPTFLDENKENVMSERVLVTGAAGFVGQYVVAELLAKGYDVVGLDNYSKYGDLRSAFDDHPRYHGVRGDAKDGTLLAELLDGCDHLIAGAAMIGGIGYFHHLAYDLLAENERITAGTCDAAIQAMRAGRLKKVTYVSSSMVFESAKTFPSVEGDQRIIPPPASAYGFQKLAVEYYARAAWDQYGVPFTIVRPFNCVGTGEQPSVWQGEALPGNALLARSHVVPDLIERVLQGESPLRILGDGTQVRHYTYGGDLARGIVLAMERDEALNQDFNLSIATGTSVRELAELIWRKIHGDRPFELESVPAYQHDVQVRIPDVNKARDMLGFEATTSLDEVLDEVIPWVRQHLVPAA